MKRSFGRFFMATLAALALASFALAPVADARGGGGGGGGRGGGGGGGAHAAAGGGGGGGARGGGGMEGGGGRQNAQVNNSRADARTNDVRNTSVNNVNVNRNVNVNVDQHGGCCNNGWDHPVAGAMVVGGAMAVTAAAIGSIVAAPPPGCVPVNYGGVVYQQCGGAWYAPQGSQFVVVNPPY